MAATTSTGKIETYLGAKSESLLGFNAPKISKDRLHLPGPDFVDRIWTVSNRNIRVLTNLQRMFNHGRLARTGYLSILPVDQGIEHSAGASFAKNPDYFDAENIVKLAMEGRMQRCCFHFWRSRRGGPQVRAQNSLYRKNQPQRIADLSE